jgi:formylglycine-generating enzyme required for sulfatase activity
LPSEAEWEYGARAGTITPFAYGETITPEIVNYKGTHPFGNAAKGINRQKTVPVGSLRVANAFGLYDVHGNVGEWCQDLYHPSYNGAPTDGSAWLSGERTDRVTRGGSWNEPAIVVRSADRDSSPANDRYYALGFRVVVVARTQ